MPEVNVKNIPTYNMRDLTQHTARVLDEINESGKAAAITKRGRFVALIVPLVEAHVERVAVTGPLADELAARAAEAEEPDARTYSSDEVAEMLQKHYGQ